MTHVQLVPADSVSRRAFINALNDAYADYYVPIFISPSFFKEMIKRDSLRVDCSVAALVDGEIVGTGLLAIRGAHGWIGGMGVIPGWRRQGIGLKMMEYLIEQATAQQINHLQLEVIAENTGAYTLYERLGFITHRELFVMVNYGLDMEPIPLVEGVRIMPPRLRFDMEAVLRLPHAPPPWQRHVETLRSYGRQLRLLPAFQDHDLVGAGLFVEQSAGINLMWLAAVDSSVGAQLLHALFAEFPGYPITFLNVGDDHPLLTTLVQTGFQTGITQYEMVLNLEH